MDGHAEFVSTVPKNVQPYFHKWTQMTIRNGCLLWGLRVVIPQRYHQEVWTTGYNHSLARLHAYIIDVDIEHYIKACNDCATAIQDPIKVPLKKWEMSLCTW